MAWAIRFASSSRCSSDSEFISRSAACIRRTRESTSSSRFSGLSGNMSPYWSMKSSKSCCVCSPRVSASSIWRRSAIMSLTRCMAAGSGFSRACFMPLNWLSSTSRRSRSRSSSNFCRASCERQSYSDSSRMAREVSFGSVSSSASRSRASSLGSGNSAPRSASRASSSSSRAWSSMPSSRPALRSSRCRSRTRRIRSSRPRRSCQPRRSRSRSASRGVSPPRIRSPISSSASLTSYGGASGSGPSS